MTEPVRVGQLIRERKIIVCCGAGGVGKTTTAAAISIAAARAGRKVLVLTIDPSRRLAETLGVSRNPPKPVRVPEDRQQAAGIEAPGALDAWMLDPRLVADEAVRRLSKSPEDAERILSNRIYQQVSTMVAGMHEYTAMEALSRLVSEGHYDLVVLDTPPSRHALDFLEAPHRLSGLVDSRAISAFLPSGDGVVARAASRVIQKILAAVFGDDFASEFIGFLSTFTGIFRSLNVNVGEMRRFLSGPDVAFLLVSSPAPATLTEAYFFQDKTKALELPFRAFVLNRSKARALDRTMPPSSDDSDPVLSAGLARLHQLAELEQHAAVRDLALLDELKKRAGDEATALALPELPQGADDIGTLVAVADLLAAS